METLKDVLRRAVTAALDKSIEGGNKPLSTAQLATVETMALMLASKELAKASTAVMDVTIVRAIGLDGALAVASALKTASVENITHWLLKGSISAFFDSLEGQGAVDIKNRARVYNFNFIC